MKKLAIIGPVHPYRGGIAAFNERLGLEFMNQGWELQCYNFTLQYPSIFFPGKDQYHQGTAPPGLNIKRTINSINPISWFRTASQINAYEPDLVISKFWHPYLGPALGRILRSVKAKTLVSLDNVFPHERKPGDTLLTNYFVNSADYFVAMSDAVLKDLHSIDPKAKSSLCPHPIYDNYGELVPKEDAIKQLNLDPSYSYFLFFGYIRAYKGLDILLKSFRTFLDKSPSKVKLIIAGEYYDDKAKYDAIIQDLKLEDHLVIRSDFIPNDEVKLYFSAADLVTQTYHHATQSGITQIAIHFQKPMLLTNVGGLHELIDHGKHGYVVPVDKEAISDSMIDFVQHERGKEFEEQIEELKKRYSWKSYYEAILELIKQ